MAEETAVTVRVDPWLSCCVDNFMLRQSDGRKKKTWRVQRNSTVVFAVTAGNRTLEHHRRCRVTNTSLVLFSVLYKFTLEFGFRRGQTDSSELRLKGNVSSESWSRSAGAESIRVSFHQCSSVVYQKKTRRVKCESNLLSQKSFQTKN